MTLYTFPDPRAAVQAILTAEKAERWPAATISTKFPTKKVAEAEGAAWPLAEPWIQHAWDGTPSDEQQRERCTIRVTVWTPENKVSDGINLASLARAVLLDSGSDTVWRFTRGAGRLHGTDDDTSLPFCTFTVTAETRPTAVA